MKKFKKVVVTSLVVAGVMVGCAVNAPEESQKPAQEAKQTSETNKPQEKKKPAEKKQEAPKAKDTKLGAGTFYVGEDIEAGRYVVSTKADTSNFMVYEENGMLAVNEILGNNEQIGVNNVTVELKKGQKITIQGTNEVQLKVK